ncbi:MAG: YihY/virulence factor BrkB family protein [Lachnospiraceae bacterium]
MAKTKRVIHILMKLFNKISSDHVTAFAAQAAFFVILSFFPMVMVLLTMSQYLPFTANDLINMISSIIPPEFQSFVTSIINEIYGKASTTLFTVTIVSTLWAASKGMMSIATGFNSVYNIDESRNYFIFRIISTFYTLIFCIVLVTTLTLLVFGNNIYAYVIQHFPFLTPIMNLIISARVLLIIVILVLFFDMLYCFIPNRQSNLVRELPGAIFATASWIIISYMISMFFDTFTNFSYMYGSLSTVVLIMLWLYFCMMCLFIGAEINHFIFHNYLMEARRLRRKLKSKHF